MSAGDFFRDALARATAFARSPSTRNAAEFVTATLGVVLVAITPNPPETWRHWLQIIGGAALSAYLATKAGRREVERNEPRLSQRLARWLLRRRVAVASAVLLTLLLAFGVPPLWQLTRGLSYGYLGCPPATQLRLVTDPETITTARRLVDDYEQATAAGNYGCATTRIYAYPASADGIAARLDPTDGWSETSHALGEVGPRPDIWLAGTGHEVDTVQARPGQSPVAGRSTVALSPLVLAVPAAAAGTQPDGTWSDYLRRYTDRGPGMIRADPRTSELALLATALIYTPAGPLSADDVERRLASSLNRGGYPIGDASDLLCRRRQLTAPADDGSTKPGSVDTAIIATEQQVIRFNTGAPLGGSCTAAVGRLSPELRLRAIYPTDTGAQDLQLVRLNWSSPAQQEAATAFGNWLGGDDGRAAIVRTGLRPVVASPSADPLTVESGIDPNLARATPPVPADRWTATAQDFEAAQRPSRLLFVVDTSTSMTTAAPEGSRFQVAVAALKAGLRGIGSLDEFGLWFFPTGPKGGPPRAVPIGLRDDDRLRAADQALDDVAPAGNTPLYTALIDGVDAVADDDRTRVTALVVITDGKDTSGVPAAEAATAAAERGVRVVVLTLGDVRCSDAGLSAVSTGAAGSCIDTEPSTLDSRVAEVVAELRGSR